jgi:peptide/nickel transport system permease protein
MLNYIIRRTLYAIPTLIGVLVLTYFLFFGIVPKEIIARQNLSSRNPTPEQITQWLKDHGYDKPAAEQLRKSTVDMLLFNFGKSDTTGEDIKDRIKQGAVPSLIVGSMVFIASLFVSLTLAIVAAYFRGTYVDGFITFICVLLMSIVYVVYVIGLQYLLGKILHYGPIAGFDTGPGMLKFLLLPVIIGVIAGIGTEIRLFRTFLLDEINQDYVRTARAKGIPEKLVLVRHVLKNAMIPVLTSTVTAIPSLILGSLVLENFFGIPGLGSYLVDAINSQDFAVVRAMVFLGTLLYIVGLILTDVLYALVDPRVRLE